MTSLHEHKTHINHASSVGQLSNLVVGCLMMLIVPLTVSLWMIAAFVFFISILLTLYRNIFLHFIKVYVLVNVAIDCSSEYVIMQTSTLRLIVNVQNCGQEVGKTTEDKVSIIEVLNKRLC